MTENQKRRLNSSVIEFVNHASDREPGGITTGEILDAYVRAHRDLVRTSGVSRVQLGRMVDYTLEIGYPQDPFLVCQFDLDPIVYLELAGSPAGLSARDRRILIRALDLYLEEQQG
jgi:hypothetical protein